MGNSYSAADVKSELTAIGQEHLVAGWTSETSEADKERFTAQVKALDASYPGGIKAYIANAKQLLADSKAGLNPLEGWTPSVPDGATLGVGSEAFLEHEAVGLPECGACGFVLVAGGLGERLGFSGIKVALPYQTTSGETYLALYINSILALQTKASKLTGKAVTLPLAIMVSDDTAARTEALLKEKGYFGMKPSQVTLMKQEKVPCLADNDARLALDPKDPFSILTKPHGHGDVHLLMHSSKTLESWEAAGIKWVYFFQDTNALAFKVLPACLGVSVKKSLEVNSVAVARTAGESIGGIMTLKHTDGRAMTVNVEYNQIDALLKATVDERGDVAGPDGYSPYPGSINQLLFALRPYAKMMRQTGGTMPEFVNPKYTDGTKTAFKAPTRLECMMQDYPKSLPPSSNVGFTVVTGATTFSPVKTNLVDARAKSKKGEPTYSAASGEADAYLSTGEMLAAAGVPLPPAPLTALSGVKVALGAKIVIDPSFATGLAEWKAKLPTPEAVSLGKGSTLLLLGDCSGLCIERLTLSGTLVVKMCAGANVTLKKVRVSNYGWSFKEFADGSNSDETLAIRGYEPMRSAQRELIFEQPGDYVIEDEEPKGGSCAVQ